MCVYQELEKQYIDKSLKTKNVYSPLTICCTHKVLSTKLPVADTISPLAAYTATGDLLSPLYATFKRVRNYDSSWFLKYKTN